MEACMEAPLGPFEPKVPLRASSPLGPWVITLVLRVSLPLGAPFLFGAHGPYTDIRSSWHHPPRELPWLLFHKITDIIL